MSGHDSATCGTCVRMAKLQALTRELQEAEAIERARPRCDGVCSCTLRCAEKAGHDGTCACIARHHELVEHGR